MKRATLWLLVVIGICVGAVVLNGCKGKSTSAKAKPRTIHEAAKTGDKVAVEKFLAQDARVDDRDMSGLTPLHWAAWYGNTDVVELLLDKGADIHSKWRRNGMTSLHYAAAYGQNEAVELLIARGADVNARNKYGGTPLSATTTGRGKWKEVVELLIANGALVNTKNRGGLTPLHSAVINGQPEVLELLLSMGADDSAKDGAGKTPLERAIILSETRFRKGSIQARQKKQFEACAELLREYAGE